MLRTAVVALLALLAACAQPGVEVAVTRFHTNPPRPVQTVAVVPADPRGAESLAFAAEAAAVAAELERLGFPPAGPDSADLLATLSVATSQRAVAPSPSPVRIGFGVGGGSRSGVSGGMSVSTGVGAPRSREVSDVEMTLAIRRRQDGLRLWEGRAVATGLGAADMQDRAGLNRALASALLADFPGRSGETRTVRLPR